MSTNIGVASGASLHLARELGIGWHSSQEPTNAWAKGWAFGGDTLLDAQHLCEVLVSVASQVAQGQPHDLFNGLLGALNGHFALAAETEGLVFAAVDRVRSIPLFYGERDGRLYVSDDAFWVKDQVGDNEPDPLSIQEFLLAGYVTGPDTLYPRVKQLQAGEYLIWEAEGGGDCLSTHRYYRWIHGNYSAASEEELLAEMDRVHLRVFERLLRSTEGHTVVIPLSGGLDSRLIAVMSRRLGRQDVICFSYGRPGNRESEVSRRVAKMLGYPWLFVPYDRRRWSEWYHSAEWAAYSRYACGLCSLPHVQDWPAVWMLRQRGEIPADAVFVPGHSADLLAGSRSASLPQLYSTERLSVEQVVFAVRHYHYSLHRWPAVGEEVHSHLKARIASAIDDAVEEPDGASAFEVWDVAERQAKFIVNSVRVYEFWGYDWRLPFWDSEVMDYWATVPLPLRRDKWLYNRYVAATGEAVGLDGAALPQRSHGGAPHVKATLKQLLGDTPITIAALKMRRTARLLLDYWRHPMAWYGIYSFGDHLRQVVRSDTWDASGFCINSIVAVDELSRLGISLEQ